MYVPSPYPAKLIYLNFQPLEVVSRYRDQNLKWLKIIHICSIWDQAFINMYVQTVI